jgi:hypothetical protein
MSKSKESFNKKEKEKKRKDFRKSNKKNLENKSG